MSKQPTRQLVMYDDGTQDELFYVPARRYWRHKRDHEILGRLRTCATPDGAAPGTAGCPAVWVLHDEENMNLNKYWQFFLCGINPLIRPKQVINELGTTRALANGTGVGEDDRRNYVTGENTTATKDLAFDKDRTMSNSMLSGIPVPNGKLWFKNPRTNQMQWFTGYLIVDVMDGTKNPPMKPGKRQPETLEQINFEDYLYNPRDYWHLFFALNIVNFSGDLIPFAGGALYSWFFGGMHPVCFMPHVSRKEVLYPLEFLEELPVGTARIKPYTK